MTDRLSRRKGSFENFGFRMCPCQDGDIGISERAHRISASVFFVGDHDFSDDMPDQTGAEMRILPGRLTGIADDERRDFFAVEQRFQRQAFSAVSGRRERNIR